ncbi:signal peptide peptidase SppA [bacterium]|nr:signal peptide peptidase SppA [bacterium]
MKKFWIVMLIIVILVAGVMFAGWLMLRQLEGDAGGPTQGVLHWTVDGPYAEKRDQSMVGLVSAGYRPLMSEMTAALRRAARDDGITGLLLRIEYAPMHWAQLEELREAVAHFAATGKPVAAWLTVGGSREYALALAADVVALPPEGVLMITGAAAELTFLAGTLDKLGMEADYVHVGRYKSAPEMMTRTSATAAHREMIEAIVDDQYDRYLDMLVAGRGLSRESAVAAVDRGVWDAAGAVAAGLADTVSYFREFRDEVFVDERTTEMWDYVYAGGGGGGGPRVALVPVSGTIVDGESSDGWRGATAGSATVAERLRDAALDDRIDAIVLRVDSPGGSASASDVIWHEVVAARATKPVVISMSGYAASGGYYVSCGADSIFAGPGTLTGSIGVFAGKIDRHGFFDKIGVQREYVQRGENALIFGDHAKFTPPQRRMLQTHLDDFYERFLERVAEGRGLDRDQVHAVAQGRVWTGRQALEAGLVDGLGGLDRALDSVRRLLDVAPDEPLVLVTRERRLGLLERWIVRALRETDLSTPLTPQLRAMARAGLLHQAELCDGRPLTLLPWGIEFR